MGRQPNFGTPLAFGLIIAALIIGYFYNSAESSDVGDRKSITVEGEASRSLDADHGVWTGRTINETSSLQRGRQMLATDRELLRGFVAEMGFDSSRISFDPVELQGYPREGGRTSRYTLIQGFSLRGDEVARIEDAAEGISSLLERGVRVESDPPRFFRSGMDSLRKDLLMTASAMAAEKAEAMVANSNASLGGLLKMKEGKLRVSGVDPHGGSGPMNESTHSIERTVSLSVKAKYAID